MKKRLFILLIIFVSALHFSFDADVEAKYNQSALENYLVSETTLLINHLIDFKKSSLIKTSQPNLLKCVILGKKGWGLWLNQWTDGIADWTFTKEEILNEFIKINLDIPESFMNDFNNRLEKKKILRNQKYLENLLHH